MLRPRPSDEDELRVTLVASPSPNGEEGLFLAYDLGGPRVP